MYNYINIKNKTMDKITTFEQFIDSQLLSESTKKRYQRAYDLAGFGKEEATEEKIIKLIAKLVKKGYSVSTIKTTLSAFSVKTPLINKTIRALERRLYKAPKQAKTFYEDTFLRFWEDEKIPINIRVHIGLLFWGALRASEVLALDRTCFNYREGTVRIKQSKTDQKKKGATLRLPSILLDEIEKNKDVKFNIKSRTTLHRWIKKYLGEKYSSHSGRRSFVTCAILDKGASPAQVMVHTRHKNAEMINVYMDEHRHNEMSAINLFQYK